MATHIEHLEETVSGTLAEHDLRFDADAGVVRVPAPFTGWAPSTVLLLLAGVAGVFTAIAVAFLGPGSLAAGSLAAGIAFLALFGWANRRPGFEVRLRRRVVAYKRARVPFHQVQPDYLVVERTGGSGSVRLAFRGGGVDTAVATFRAGEQDAALRLRQQLWELFAASGGEWTGAGGGNGGYGSTLTPVQVWITGTFAIFADVNGLPLDRLGSAYAAQRPVDRRNAQRVLAAAWEARDKGALLDRIDALVSGGREEGSAEGGGQDAERGTAQRTGSGAAEGAAPAAAVATLPQDAKQEYARLLRWADDCAANGGRIGAPPLDDVLRRLVFLRHGPEGARYARLYDAFAAGMRPAGAGTGPEVGALAEIERFATRLAGDRSFWREEAQRAFAPAGRQVAHARNTYMIWDYARAMMLYRWGHLAGWLAEDYCWDRMLPLAREVQRHYESWQEMAGYYLGGRRRWAGGAPAEQHRFEQAAAKLREDERSPWNTVEWGLPLHRDW